MNYVPTFGDPDDINKAFPESDISRLEKLEIRGIDLDDRYREIEEELAELHNEQHNLEDEMADVEKLIAELKASPQVPDGDGLEDLGFVRVSCTTCPFDLESDNVDSLLFRAENHAHETGHVVATLHPGDVLACDDSLFLIGAAA